MRRTDQDDLTQRCSIPWGNWEVHRSWVRGYYPPRVMYMYTAEDGGRRSSRFLRLYHTTFHSSDALDEVYIYFTYSIELPSFTISSNFQSTSTPCSKNRLRASSAMRSNPSVARARMVGPAPDKHMPSSPRCVAGVIWEVTSMRPGICGIVSVRGEQDALNPTKGLRYG